MSRKKTKVETSGATVSVCRYLIVREEDGIRREWEGDTVDGLARDLDAAGAPLSRAPGAPSRQRRER